MEENLEPIQGFQAIFHEQNIPPVATNHRQNHISQITNNGTSVSNYQKSSLIVVHVADVQI